MSTARVGQRHGFGGGHWGGGGGFHHGGRRFGGWWGGGWGWPGYGWGWDGWDPWGPQQNSQCVYDQRTGRYVCYVWNGATWVVVG